MSGAYQPAEADGARGVGGGVAAAHARRSLAGALEGQVISGTRFTVSHGTIAERFMCLWPGSVPSDWPSHRDGPLSLLRLSEAARRRVRDPCGGGTRAVQHCARARRHAELSNRFTNSALPLPGLPVADGE